jgi:hypothetical protein
MDDGGWLFAEIVDFLVGLFRSESREVEYSAWDDFWGLS